MTVDELVVELAHIIRTHKDAQPHHAISAAGLLMEILRMKGDLKEPTL